MYTERIKALVDTYYDEAVKIRHHIHKYPELSFQEENTAKLIEETLTKCGIKHKRLFNTGVVGLIEGAKSGKTVLLRADMDALEMDEESDCEYKSHIPGVMHSCGHDGHTAGLLLAAMVLNDMKDLLCGNVKLMFQPGEETDGGALPMIEEGVLENPKVSAAFGCHLWGSIEEGKVMFKSGALMASPDDFEVKLEDNRVHSDVPVDSDLNLVSLAADIINDFQSIISRRKSPTEPAVISVCSIHGGHSEHCGIDGKSILDSVEFKGTVRSFDGKMREWFCEEMGNLVMNITEYVNLTGCGITSKFDFHFGYPPLINDEKMTTLAKASAAKVVGEENAGYMKEPNMGGEDFAYLCERVPSSFFFVGITKDKDCPVIHHNSQFSFDDKVLKISASCLSQTAIDFLNNTQSANDLSSAI